MVQHLSAPRYVDIVLGISFLLTHAVLMHSSKHESKSNLTIYFVLSVFTLLLYWFWFAYLKYAMAESEASKEVTFQIFSKIFPLAKHDICLEILPFISIFSISNIYVNYSVFIIFDDEKQFSDISI